MQDQATDQIRCKVCDRGILERRKIFRMGTPAVVIGVLLLIPSLIVMAVGAVCYIASLALPSIGASLAGTWFSLIWIIVSFIGGLLGWLLVMKKTVLLQCNVCDSVISAGNRTPPWERRL